MYKLPVHQQKKKSIKLLPNIQRTTIVSLKDRKKKTSTQKTSNKQASQKQQQRNNPK